MIDFLGRFIVFALSHSLLATRRVQLRVAPLLGDLFRWYRLSYNLLSIALFVWVLAAWDHPQTLYAAPPPWNLALRISQVGAMFLFVRCASQVGVGSFLGIDQLRAVSSPPMLITTGCYARSRHPQYVLAILFMVTNPVMSTKWFALTLLAAVYFVIGSIIEERRLREDFGDDYRRYSEEVPMFIPRLRK